GKMSLAEAVTVMMISLLVYLLAAWCLSDFCLKLSWIPILAFAAYPYFKRFTKWAHVGLGLVWSLVPVSGFFAVRRGVDGIGPVLLLAVFSIFWLAGFDIIYATMDEDFDRQAGLFSLPACLGSDRALRISALFHVLAFLMLFALYGIFFSGPVT